MEEAALTVIPAGKYNNTIIATLDDLKMLLMLMILAENGIMKNMLTE